MTPYIQTFELRWEDLDANRHLANTSYLSLMTETRMRFLKSHGFTQELFEQHQLGPAVFSEHIHYFREVKGGTKVYVDLELKGLSDDAVFFQFHQHLYNEQGKICAHLEVTAGWFSLATRKLTTPPDALREAVAAIPKTSDFKVLTKADTRKANPDLLKRSLAPAHL